MRDVVFVAIIVVFFGIAAAYVRACSALIGKDELVPSETSEIEELGAEVGIAER
jgi:hypothetical protein